MIEKPFLLDPRYEGTLDSSLFRHRFVAAHLGSFPLKAMVVMLALGGAVGIFGLIVWAWQFVLAAGIYSVMVMLLSCTHWIDVVANRARRRRFHRLAWEGELVFGRVVSCVRKLQSGEYVVEVQYEATTPKGLSIRGERSRMRDDLLNATLPAPGTPVALLVLDETDHEML